MPNFTDFDKLKLYLLLRLHLLPTTGPAKPAGPMLRVVIIRHGEKPAEGDNLSCAGLRRALALPTVLDRLLPTPPDFTYVPVIGTNDDSTSQARMFQTVTPYAVRHNLCVNSDYQVADTKALAADLRRKRGTALVVWEHENIPKMARKLGLKNPPGWPDADFDSIWIIDFHGGRPKGKAKRPTLSQQRQAIRPPAGCTAPQGA